MVHLGDDVFVHSGDDVYKCLLLCRRLHCLKAGCQAVTGRADEDAAALLMMVMICVYYTDGHGVCVFLTKNENFLVCESRKMGTFQKRSVGAHVSLFIVFFMVFKVFLWFSNGFLSWFEWFKWSLKVLSWFEWFFIIAMILRPVLSQKNTPFTRAR